MTGPELQRSNCPAWPAPMHIVSSYSASCHSRYDRLRYYLSRATAIHIALYNSWYDRPRYTWSRATAIYTTLSTYLNNFISFSHIIFLLLLLLSLNFVSSLLLRNRSKVFLVCSTTILQPTGLYVCNDNYHNAINWTNKCSGYLK